MKGGLPGEPRSSHATKTARFAAAALVLWIALGLAHTGVVLFRPDRGWFVMDVSGMERALGVPRQHENASELVTHTLELFDRHLPGDESVWIVRHDSLEDDTWLYVQMQLAHILYPRLAFVLDRQTAAAHPIGFHHAVAFDGADPGPDWAPIETREMVTLYALREG